MATATTEEFTIDGLVRDIDGRLEALRADLSKLEAAKLTLVGGLQPNAPKRRGRPPGSRNKRRGRPPKDAA